MSRDTAGTRRSRARPPPLDQSGRTGRGARADHLRADAVEQLSRAHHQRSRTCAGKRATAKKATILILQGDAPTRTARRWRWRRAPTNRRSRARPIYFPAKLGVSPAETSSDARIEKSWFESALVKRAQGSRRRGRAGRCAPAGADRDALSDRRRRACRSSGLRGRLCHQPQPDRRHRRPPARPVAHRRGQERRCRARSRSTRSGRRGWRRRSRSKAGGMRPTAVVIAMFATFGPIFPTVAAPPLGGNRTHVEIYNRFLGTACAGLCSDTDLIVSSDGHITWASFFPDRLSADR